jgi:hypothetical protein
MAKMIAAAVLLLTLVVWAGAQALVDTIGFTDRDRQMYGPAIKYLVNDTLSGVHAVWKDGFGIIRYNFRPRSGDWRWPNGAAVNTDPRNLGCLDVDVSDGTAVLSADYLFRNAHLLVWLADSAPGAAVFRATEVSPDYKYTLVGTANYGYTKFAVLSNETLCYRSYLADYPLGYVGAFPSFNLAVSKQSGRYGYIWAANDGPDRGVLFLKQTPNNGQNWYAASRLSDSVPSALNRTLLSACGTYDTIRVHLVTDMYDGANRHRAQLWHYSPDIEPVWSLVYEYSCGESVDLGDDALAACRPSIGMNRALGEVYVTWEQFDPANPDPQTGQCRADIWAARSTDQGRTWGRAVRLTAPDSTSKRFPFLAEVVDDTLRIICFADKVAGFSEQGQGPRTTNAVLYLRVPVDELPVGIAEPGRSTIRALVSVTPTVSSTRFRVSVPPGTALHSASVYDESGALRAHCVASVNQLTWGDTAAPGVYFLRVETDGGSSVSRVIKIR